MSSAVMMVTLAGASARVCGWSDAPSTLIDISCSRVIELRSEAALAAAPGSSGSAAPANRNARAHILNEHRTTAHIGPNYPMLNFMVAERIVGADVNRSFAEAPNTAADPDRSSGRA